MADDFEKAKKLLPKITEENVRRDLENKIKASIKEQRKKNTDVDALIANEDISEGIEILIQKQEFQKAIKIASSRSDQALL